MEGQVYSSGEAQRLVGVTQRQLAYWDTTGFIRPTVHVGAGKGSRRLYSYLDLVQLKTAKKLLDAGMSLQAVRKSIAFLQQLPGVDYPLAELVLVSDGRSIYAYRESDVILDVLRRGQLTCWIPMRQVVREIDQAGGRESPATAQSVGRSGTGGNPQARRTRRAG
jgi:DNA-binding transcriptional MerR regulator